MSLKERIEAMYEQAFDKDKLEVQRDLAANFHVCCAEPKSGAHHPACHNFVPVEQPLVIDGQESLL